LSPHGTSPDFRHPLASTESASRQKDARQLSKEDEDRELNPGSGEGAGTDLCLVPCSHAVTRL